MKFAYRKNLFLPKDAFVWGAELGASLQDSAKIRAAIEEVLVRRKKSQPLDFPSCGSVFKNPKGSEHTAWQIIEKLGLRGHKIGGAQFSPKHCNFIVNLGSAKAIDVRELI